ncbi:MAG: restriction endonuclease subunit R [Calditrichaeota bacterium]|nr:MAG: restriction endonuclease subunit R [Calditrichota bacterium]
MSSDTIANPVINSPFEEPARHFRFADEGITNEIVPERRKSAYFVPIPKPRRRGPKQLAMEFEEWTADRLEENKLINQIRQRVGIWRKGGYQGVTRTTRKLLEYWQRPDREPRLFFAQIEALETAIYLTEVAHKYNDGWIMERLREGNQQANPELFRMAFKMATGTGKTVVMGMLIAWHVLNKQANPQDNRFSDAFLIVTPGITIRDRLRVLLPSDGENYYRRFDLVPPAEMEKLHRARVVVTNFHAMQLRERVKAGKLTKELLAKGEATPFTETPDQMVRRVCRALGNKKNIIVINDEAHHCYRHRPPEKKERLSREEREELKKHEQEARVWISGLEAVKRKIGIRVVYDLSATPFFLRGSGYKEGTLFPWVVSDFSLVDAIESGIVKVPRVPIDDDAMLGDYPVYRHLWPHVKDGLPKKGRGTQAVEGPPRLPAKLESALHSLYNNYEKYHKAWQEQNEPGVPPPVFIVVANNTNVSRMIYDYIAGWEKTLSDGRTVLVPGALPLFSNVISGAGGNRWASRPTTILVDSEQLESGETMSKEFKQIAAPEIQRFKDEYRQRFPGRDPDKLTDEDLLREVMNTVGKPGKLGEHVKCVVSVSMLTEGWDANTVTHILGVRAFGTQLLCEQVVGRGLRRIGYETETRTLEVDGETVEIEAFPVEYAEVYGVPFSFIPTREAPKPAPPPRRPTRVRAMEERIAAGITFPRVLGYRYELPPERLDARFTPDSQMALSTQDVPTRVENAPLIGEASVHTLYDLQTRRVQEMEFRLAKRVLERFFSDDEGALKPWLFPDILRIVREWHTTQLTLKDNAFPQMLLFAQLGDRAAEKIYQAIVQAEDGAPRILPRLQPYDTLGSTRYVDFNTTRPVWVTDPAKCHVSHVVADTNSWEQKTAQALEEMPEVLRYVKNHNLGFTIPYTLDGQEKQYIPDFIVHLDDGHGPDDPLQLILEVSGENRIDKAAKVAAARNLWVPAVNNHGGFGRWAFLEIRDPWDVQNTIRGFLEENKDATA